MSPAWPASDEHVFRPRQRLSDAPGGVEYTPPPFNQPLIYRFVRHPLMLSTLIAFWATPGMSVGHLVFAAGMTLYVVIGIAFEELSEPGLASLGRERLPPAPAPLGHPWRGIAASGFRSGGGWLRARPGGRDARYRTQIRRLKVLPPQQKVSSTHGSWRTPVSRPSRS